MGNRQPEDNDKKPMKRNEHNDHLPTPSASYRRRAWIEFQRALDPLAPIKPLPPHRS
jgi:hypothetical protein